MKTVSRALFKKLFPAQAARNQAYRLLIRNRNSYLHSSGWMQSLQDEKPVDTDGGPLPWMNFPVIHFLEERLKADQHLFEFGSGYSTRFYAARVAQVTSVEYDDHWYHVVEDSLPDNATLVLQDKDVDGEYCRVAVNSGKTYDVIVVDGRDRVNCVKQSIDALTPTGVLLLDDSQRERYQEGVEFAKQRGFKHLHLEGLKPTGPGLDRTTIFYRADNCFDL